MEILMALIKNEAIVALKKNFDKFNCVLYELNSDYKFTIKNVPQDTIVIKADKFPAPLAIFKGSKMECKRADFVIITEIPTKQIFYIELKRSKSPTSSEEMNAQLKGAKCVMEYCKAIGKEFWKVQDFLEGYETKYVKFFAQTLGKRPTRQKMGKSSLHTYTRDSNNY